MIKGDKRCCKGKWPNYGNQSTTKNKENMEQKTRGQLYFENIVFNKLAPSYNVRNPGYRH